MWRLLPFVLVVIIILRMGHWPGVPLQNNLFRSHCGREFLWEFIDKERLLAQWREAGTARGERWDRDRNEIQSQDRATTFRHRDRAAPFRDRVRCFS